MKVYKDNEHSLALSPFYWRGKRYLTVCVGLYATFDAESGQSRLRSEQDFWKEAPDVFAALGQAPVVDMGLPKPGAEVLVAGFCRTPGGKPLPALEAAFRVGSLARRIAVFGDRQRLRGGGFSDPLPFTAMPLVWEKALGGPDFPANPAGRGLGKDNKPTDQTPNLEDPEHFILSGHDMPRPACPLPVPADNPERCALSGTYDKQWLENRWPAYPDDLNPDFFYSAPSAQRLTARAGNAGDTGDALFFRGDEEVEIIGMSREIPHIRARLPERRVRAFVTTVEKFTPFAPADESGTSYAQAGAQNAPLFPAAGAEHAAPSAPAGAKAPGTRLRPLPYVKDLNQPGIFREVQLRADTVWLLPDLLGSFVLYRGLLPVEDDEMDDILRIFVASEKLSDAPKSPEHYLEEQKKRIRPALEIDPAPFIEAQAANTKAVKTARDLPKFFAQMKKDFLDQSPTMPFSLGDMAHSAQKTLAGARSTLDKLEKHMLSQREQFSHLLSFDLSVFSDMRADLDANEKDLRRMLGRAERELGRAEKQTQTQLAAARGQLHDALDKIKARQEMAPDKVEAGMRSIREALGKLDGVTVEGILCDPQPLNPWHDHGFPLLIAARRDLRRDDELLACLAALGVEEKTLDDAWIGYAAEARDDRPEAWGLPAGPAFTLPAGLYVPRFDGQALVALRVYPLKDRGAPDADLLRGLGAEAPAVFLVPGSDDAPLFLPASHPDGAVCVVPEYLSALFAEQEAGDFCNVVAAPDPAALAAVPDLPPLLAEKEAPRALSGADRGSTEADDAALVPDAQPLVVVLPPEAQGKALFAPWTEAYPGAVPLFLPEGCPHVLGLAGQGKRLRRLLLDLLPPELAGRHDFDFPLPSPDGPPAPFTLNMPLPSKEEMQDRISTLIKEVRAHFPDPEKVVAEELAKAREQALSMLRGMERVPQEAFDKVEAAFAEAARPKPLPETESVAEMMAQALAALADARGANIPDRVPAEERAKIAAAYDKAEKRLRRLGEHLAPLDKLRAEGEAKLQALDKGELPEDLKAAFAAQGMDPDALKELTREDVRAMLESGLSLARKNLQGLDLSELDFSGADLSHAFCTGTKFNGCAARGANFTFTIASEADFTGADLRGARFKQAVLHKAVLRKADCRNADMELTNFGECGAGGALFDNASLNLCSFGKADIGGARFSGATLSLCEFGETRAAGADFRKARAFKCVFRQTAFSGARFEDAVLPECLFQGTAGSGLSFAGADLRKLRTDAEADFSGADFIEADLREATLVKSRFVDADFYGAHLENAFFTQCDLSRARLDGLRATGCRFLKCDLSGTDLSGTDLRNGALRKSRLTGAELSGAGLFAANLQNLVIGNTGFAGVNLKRTVLEGKEAALLRAARPTS
ncbi:MAG: DUF2169 domain-containing protein [Desulfovibrio sp.]|jgi:uncharacterized protein YjbI with pentapeptide repeats|nr:DUF2169 domain-containing protein [Desulfovibrio sp.]